MSSQNVVSFFARLVEWALDLAQSLITPLSTKLLGSTSSFLSVSWKGLLIILLVGGTALNVIIYMQRWKPHWWWFAKKRMVVDDALVEKKQKRAADPAPVRKPSTYIPKRNAGGELLPAYPLHFHTTLLPELFFELYRLDNSQLPHTQNRHP